MTQWITELVGQLGYLAIALLMMLENIFPPIPSEVIMPLAGYSAADGELNIIFVILSGTVGTSAGAFFWWWIASKMGERRLKGWAGSHGRWLTLSPAEIDHIDGWFEQHRIWAIPIAHVIPGFRTLISIPAGLFGTKLPRFLMLTIIGATAWNSVLAGMGYWLEGKSGAVDQYLGTAGMVIMGGILLYYLYRVFTFRARTDNA